MKKQRIQHFLFFLVLLWTAGCQEKTEAPKPVPIPDFSISGGGCTAPCEVSFTNKSTHATSYQWDFGDTKSSSNTSTDENPKHTYQQGGTYTVTLKATGEGGTTQYRKDVSIGLPISKFIVRSISLESVPYTNSATGAKWDADTDPDLFFTITGPVPANTVVYQQTDELLYRNWGSTRFPFTHTLPSAVTINNVSDTYRVNVYDSDGAVDELMGFVDFKLSDYTTGSSAYPTSIRKVSQGTAITLNVSWSK